MTAPVTLRHRPHAGGMAATDLPAEVVFTGDHTADRVADLCFLPTADWDLACRRHCALITLGPRLRIEGAHSLSTLPSGT